MKRYFLFLLIPFLFIFSCKKDKLITPPEVKIDLGYFQTKTGSYWIYEWFTIDSLGIETALGKFDTLRNVGFKTINNNQYVEQSSRLIGLPAGNRFLRDSLGYIVDQNGEIHYSYVDFSDTLFVSEIAPVQIDWHRKMVQNSPVTVPVGSFTALELKQFFYAKPSSPFSICNGFASYSTWIAPDVGMVKRTCGYFSQMQICGSHLEGRLIDYYIP